MLFRLLRNVKNRLDLGLPHEDFEVLSTKKDLSVEDVDDLRKPSLNLVILADDSDDLLRSEGSRSKAVYYLKSFLGVADCYFLFVPPCDYCSLEDIWVLEIPESPVPPIPPKGEPEMQKLHGVGKFFNEWRADLVG